MSELALLLWLGSVADAAPTVVVTLDNGEFNLPFFTPRWNGKWEKPSAAQEVVSAVARVIGDNPRTFTYLPPDQGRLGPGGVHLVEPRRVGCVGSADGPSAPCACAPGDNCWSGVRPNWYSGASTSLWLTAANARKVVGEGPRVEVHFTDLFEEDPAAAADPKDSDRCVTEAGVRRAVAALVSDSAGSPLDHVAIGVLRATIDPPPPGGGWGTRYQLASDPAAPECHRGFDRGEWNSRAGAWKVSWFVAVLGFGTAGDDAVVSSFVDGLVGQLDTGGFEIELVRLREPAIQAHVSRTVTVEELAGLQLVAPGRRPSLGCGSATATLSLFGPGEMPLPVQQVTATCDAAVTVQVDERDATRAFLRSAGLDPRRRVLPLHGDVAFVSSTQVLADRWAQAVTLNESDRPLPLIGAIAPALLGDGGVARPWQIDLIVDDLTVTQVDRRPWALAVLSGGVVGAVLGIAIASFVRRLHADRAIRRHWTRSLGAARDPRLQVPMAAVLGAANEEVARSWPLRVVAGTAAGLFLAGMTGLAILLAYRVILG